MSHKKSDIPSATVRHYYRNREAILQKRRERYASDPEVRTRKAAYDACPERKAKRNEANRKSNPARYEKLKSNPEAWAARLEFQNIRRTGFTNAFRAAVVAVQDGKCGICGRELDPKTARADHCHDRQAPRGVLCHNCNIVEGMIRGTGIPIDEYLKRVRAYLDSPPAALVTEP